MPDKDDKGFKKPEGFFDALFRSNSAIQGAATFALQGKDPFQGLLEGASRGELGGQDTIGALFGIDRDSKVARQAGLVLDIVNPADPLNFIGIGGLTKAGKAARLGGKLAGTIGDQARVGQRGLATFAGHRVPLPGDAFILDKLGRQGAKIKASKPGRAVKKAFGGRGGALEVGLDEVKGMTPEMAAALVRATEVAEQSATLVRGELSPFVTDFHRNLRTPSFLRPKQPDENVAALKIFDRAGADPSSLQQDIVKFVGVGKGSERRQKAVEAMQKFAVSRDVVGKNFLGDFGVAAFTSPQVGFASRIRKLVDDDVFEQIAEPIALAEDKTGRTLGRLQGIENNQFNRGLNQVSTLDFDRKLLTTAGLSELERMGAVAAKAAGKAPSPKFVKGAEIDKLSAEKLASQRLRFEKDAYDALSPQDKSAFNRRFGIPLEELDQLLVNAGEGGVETNIVKVLKRETDELVDNIRHTDLVRSLKASGQAKTFREMREALGKEGKEVTDKMMASLKETGLDGQFMRINAGEFVGEEALYIDRILDSGLKKFHEVYLPSPDKTIFAQMLNDFMPKVLQNFGALSWWKGFALIGVNPGGFWTRNFVTGVHKNMFEGLGPTGGPGNMLRSAKLYQEGLSIPLRTITKRLDPEATRLGRAGEKIGASADDVFITKPLGPNGQTVSISKDRIIEDYMLRRFHGGGSPDLEIIRGMDNMSTRGREIAFGHFHRGNFRVEMGIRMPLMLKYIEDTLELAVRNGAKIGDDIPAVIGRHGADEALDAITTKTGSFYDQALTNAREAVIRAHFDYEDLSPFERKIRASWIPFYTWMRKNIPSESLNMMQQSGKYMPYARAYFSAFQQQGITPEDLPEWAQRSFSVPISPDEETNRVKWFDFTGFLPFSDILELADTAKVATGAIPFVPGLRQPQTGKTPTSEVLRYAGIKFNPFIVQVAEQSLQRNLFSGRGFSSDFPNDLFGQAVSPAAANLAGIARPISDLDRLNIPGALGLGPSPRPHRNEPSGFGERLFRSSTGIKVRQADPDLASKSRKDKLKLIRRHQRSARKAKVEGDSSRARFHEDRIKLIERGS